MKQEWMETVSPEKQLSMSLSFKTRKHINLKPEKPRLTFYAAKQANEVL